MSGSLRSLPTVVRFVATGCRRSKQAEWLQRALATVARYAAVLGLVAVCATVAAWTISLSLAAPIWVVGAAGIGLLYVRESAAGDTLPASGSGKDFTKASASPPGG